MLKIFYLCFFSKPFYRDVAHRWTGYAFSTLCIITVLFSSVYTIALHKSFRSFMQNEGTRVTAQIPDMTILSGQMRIYGNWPLYIKDSRGRVWVQYDTIYKEEQFAAGQMWITATDLYIRPFYGDVHRFSFKDIGQMSLSRQQIKDTLNSLQKNFLIFAFPLTLGIFLIYRVLQVAVLSLWGKFLNRYLGVFLHYDQIVRLTVVAFTTVLLLESALLIAGYGSWDWMSLILLGGTVIFGAIDFSLLYKAVTLCLDPVELHWYSFLLFSGYMIFGLRANRDMIR
jgi:hypothetical protein